MIYLAATYTTAPRMRTYKSQLYQLGYPVSASWIEGYGEAAPQQLCASMDLTEVTQATCVILDLYEEPNYTPGKMTEYGIALASGCETIIIGDRSKHQGVFFTLADAWLPNWSMMELQKVLETMSVQCFDSPGEDQGDDLPNAG